MSRERRRSRRRRRHLLTLLRPVAQRMLQGLLVWVTVSLPALSRRVTCTGASIDPCRCRERRRQQIAEIRLVKNPRDTSVRGHPNRKKIDVSNAFFIEVSDAASLSKAHFVPILITVMTTTVTRGVMHLRSNA